MTNSPEDNPPEAFSGPAGESAASGTEQESQTAQPKADVPAVFGIDPAVHTPPAAASVDELNVDQPNADPPLFYTYSQQPVRPLTRIPNYGHLLLLSLLIAVAFGLVGLGLGIASALGWKIPAASATDLQFNLASEAVLYLISFALSFLIFPLIWHERYFAGLQWRGAEVRSRFWILAGVGVLCFCLAFLDQVLMPGPPDAPIEKMISSPGAAWLMFGFGVTIAPFFEEMFFRGFMLPAMCTVADWTDETFFSRPELRINKETRAAFSIPAMILVCGVSVGVPAAIAYAAYGVLTSTGHHRAAIFSIAIVTGAAVYISLQAARAKSPAPSVQLDAAGHPQWSRAAMIVGSLATSLPFALLHIKQQGYSLGPFLDVLAVSLILCAVRLMTRSLAASTVVHSIYNLFIFVIELVATGGFRHFDKM